MGSFSVTLAEAVRRQQAGALLIDIREPDEHALGVPEGALIVPFAQLEASPERWIPHHESDVVLICRSGQRSLVACERLSGKGYRNVASIECGYQGWQASALPTCRPATEDPDFLERYSRHLRLPQVGLEGQRKLEGATILLVGAGGLGSPAAFYLAAAGVGRLILIDDDVVDRSNLQRQIVHTEASLGTAKVVSAEATLKALNPRVRIDAVRARVTVDTVDHWVEQADVVIDGADNFPTRYLLSDACVQAGKPLVYGAVHRFEGQVSVFDAGRNRGNAPCYRCLFPLPPAPDDAPNCSEAGVLGVLPGVIGILQATEAIKILLDIGTSLQGRLLHFDALSMRFRETRLSADPDCSVCRPGAAFSGHSPVSVSCRTPD